MADKRFSDLPSATALADADLLAISQSATSKQLTGSLLKAYAQGGVVLSTSLGATSGVATLDASGKLTSAQIPDISIVTYLGSAASQAAMLALTGQQGDWCTRSDLGTNWVITGATPSLIGSWTQLSYPTAPVTSVASKTGAVTLTASDVGAQASITVNGIVKGNGSGTLSAAVAGTDFQAAQPVTGIVKSSGTTRSAAVSGTDYVAPGASTAFTATQTFSGSASAIAEVLTNAAEVTTVSATAASGTVTIYPSTQSVLYYTTNASANWTTNITFSSGTTLNAVMAAGQSISVAFLVTQGATAYYNTTVQIDGTTTGVTTKWQGGSPTSGNASGIDVYTYTITKTANATFTVLASVTQFK